MRRIQKIRVERQPVLVADLMLMKIYKMLMYNKTGSYK